MVCSCHAGNDLPVFTAFRRSLLSSWGIAISRLLLCNARHCAVKCNAPRNAKREVCACALVKTAVKLRDELLEGWYTVQWCSLLLQSIAKSRAELYFVQRFAQQKDCETNHVTRCNSPAACLATPLRDKLLKKLHSVTGHLSFSIVLAKRAIVEQWTNQLGFFSYKQFHRTFVILMREIAVALHLQNLLLRQGMWKLSNCFATQASGQWQKRKSALMRGNKKFHFLRITTQAHLENKGWALLKSFCSFILPLTFPNRNSEAFESITVCVNWLRFVPK